ncbi:MAG TPA: efflux transporter outer membrane subunit [Methylocella sp.]|nr:efflux transporter outer membrane subunit [Methylocella sp.]
MSGRFLSLGSAFGVPLLITGCAWMPEGVERAVFLEPPSMQHTLSRAGERKAAAPAMGWPEERWWRRFGNPDLDRVMEKALADNPGLKKAFARLAEADAVAQVEGARLLPWLDSDNAFKQVRYAKHGIVASYNPLLGGAEKTSDTLNLLSFRYEFDFWGKNRAAFEAALGEAAAQEAEAAQARLLLTTALARFYIRGAALAQQLALAQEMVQLRRSLLNLAETRFRTGLDSGDERKQAAIELENATRREAGTRALVILHQNMIARLMGEGPDAAQDLLIGRKLSLPSKLTLPPELPVELLAQRPDLAAALHRAEAAAERIHVAKARFLPSVDLVTATAGLEASVFTKNIETLPGLLFRGSNLNYVVAPGIHLPIFEGGRLRGQLAAARSQYDEAVELYNDTLLRAVQEVADSLTNWKQTGAILSAQNRLLESARGKVNLTQVRLSSGLNDRREMLTSRFALLDHQYALKALEADHLTAMVDIIQALGGGYSSGISSPRPEINPEESLSGLETATPAWALEKIVTPLSPLFRN